MDGVNVLLVIGLIATFVSLLLAAFIFSVESNNKISNKLFAFFLVLLAIEFSGWFTSLLFENYKNSTLVFNFLVFKHQLSYLIIPVFYFYIVSVCYSNFKLQWKHLWHIAPFILGNIISTPRLYLSTLEEMIVLDNMYNDLYETIFMHFSLHLQSIIYITLGFITLKKAKKIFIQNYSSGTIQVYNWIFQLLLFMSAFYGVAIIKNIFKYLHQQDRFQTSQIILSLVVLSFVCWYVLKALRYPTLFTGVDSHTELLKKENNDNVDSAQIDLVTSFMKQEKPYLNPSLTLRFLAEQIQMNSRDLSVLINQNLNQHFFDFVNEYRIKEAMGILKDPMKKEFTVLEILYEVGFNSKSSFNTAFKKHTGKTPTEFRKAS